MKKLIVILFFLASTISFAEVPDLIQYRSHLAGEEYAGQSKSVNLEFRIYDVETGGMPIWQQLQPNVNLFDGNYAVLLSATAEVFSASNRYMAVSVNGAEELKPRQRIVSVPYAMQVGGIVTNENGFVGIGTNQPRKNFEVYDEKYNTQFIFNGGDRLDDPIFSIITYSKKNYINIGVGTQAGAFTTSTNSFWFMKGGLISQNNNEISGNQGSRMATINSTGIYANSFNQNSDARLKCNIDPLENTIENIKKIDGVRFNWINNLNGDSQINENRRIGLIAQDVEQVYPEIVTTNEDGYKAIDYSNLVPVLIEAIKEQQQQIEILKSEIEELKQAK